MNHPKLILSLFAVFLLLISVNCLMAQYIIEQIEYTIPFNYDLIPEDKEFESEEDEGSYILSIPESKLKEAALAEGMEILEEKSTIYIDGDNFAVDTKSEDMGKVTMVSDMKTKMMYVIMWDQKKIMEIKPEDLAKMEERVMNAAEAMLENIPPEMRDQVKAEMEKEKNKPQVKYDAQPTGNKMKLYGFNCEEYRVSKDDELIAIWASDERVDLANDIDRISGKFDELFKMNEEEDIDEWELVPGKIPVLVKTYRFSMTGEEPGITIQAITGIENKKPSADKFKVPTEDDGFTKGSMMEMMMQMMPEEE